MAATLLCACGSSDDPVELPALTTTSPIFGSGNLPVTTWLVLNFDEPVQVDLEDAFALDCDGETPEFDADLVSESTVVINPRQAFSAGSLCRLSWRSTDKKETLDFGVTATSDPVALVYDRDDATLLAPYPDDVWSVAADTSTGIMIEIPELMANADTETIVGASGGALSNVDGFSPLGSIVVELSEDMDRSSLPSTPEQSTDPLATMFIIDVDPESPTLGSRVPFYTVVHCIPPEIDARCQLLVHPAQHLSDGGQYAFVITNRAYVSAARTLAPSAFMQAGLGLSEPATPAQQKVQTVMEPVLALLVTSVSPPVRSDDIALATRFTIRSMDGLADDALSIYEQTQAFAAPTWAITDVTPIAAGSVAAVVTGTWDAPIWNAGAYLSRDTNGLPMVTGFETHQFTLAIPRSAEATPVPLTMYQHGNPGSAAGEVRGAALGLSGGTRDFATIGFTDFRNRTDYRTAALLADVIATGKWPDADLALGFAEQLAFLRLLPELATLDVLPLGAPDGVSELDLSVPLTYLGISMGSIHGTALLAYAPQIRAAALTVGGGSMSGINLHQFDTIFADVAGGLPEIDRTALHLASAISQTGFDFQDPANHTRFLYAEPHTLAGGDRRASVLMTEGLSDSLVPPWSTQPTASRFGIPLLAPTQRTIPFLEEIAGPVTGNINSETTAVLQQFTPDGVSGIPRSPGCANQSEGHACPQIAAEALTQRIEFFLSAISGETPTINEPVPPLNPTAPRTDFTPVVMRATSTPLAP